MQQLLLIDGNAILHRAYHALPPLTNSDGQIINAVYGFFSMVFTVIQEKEPTHLIVCFDRPKPTFRQSLYVGYQQNRPAMSDDLVPQVAILHAILANMRVVIFEVDGYEADDLIGTIATQVVKKHNKSEVSILSGDRDLLQLVNAQVRMIAPIVGVKNTILYDSDKVKEKFGVAPHQIIDYKALIGDASDGYPGVAGIGPKTASKLIQTYSTLEGIYKNIGELNPKIAEKLINCSEQAQLAKTLATIVTDAPIQVKLDDALLSKINGKGLVESFTKQGFKTLLERGKALFHKQILSSQDTVDQLELL